MTADLHPSALKTLRAVATTEASAMNYVAEIAMEANLSESTVRRWLHKLDHAGLVALLDEGSGRGRRDWIWGDPHIYWVVTSRGSQALTTTPAPESAQRSHSEGGA